MGMVNRFADLGHQFQPLLYVQRMSFGILYQRFALDEFHRKIGLQPGAGISHACLKNLSNSRMLQPAERFCFELEALQKVGAGESWLDNFERHCAMGTILLGLVNDAHAALAQNTHDPVTTDSFRVSVERNGCS